MKSITVYPAPTKSLNAVEAIIETRRVLQDPEAVYELRALGVRTGNGRAPVTASGYFDDIRLMAKEAATLNQRGAESIHATMNPVRSDLLARAVNRVLYSPTHTSKDDEIVCRRQLLVDLDPVRPPGVSSTDEEHKAALERARQIRQWLMEERNWPAPVVADSGNGAHLLWRIELPNDDAARELVRAVLQVQAQRFDDDKVKVDCSTFNASRISKVYGTMVRKGDDTEERPHRRAMTLDVPAEWTAVSREQLEQLASEFAPADSHAVTTPLDLQPWLEQRGLAVKSVERFTDGNGYKYILERCPFNPDHGGTSAAVFQFNEGGRGFKCQHQSCADKKWADVRRKFEVDARPPHIDSSESTGTASAEPWPAPEPLGGELTPVPAFNLKMLPEALRPLTEDVSERMQVPPEVPAVVKLVVLGAAVGRRARIQPKERDTTWNPTPQLWGMVVMPSGFMKTPTMAAILAPLREIEERWWQEHKAAVAEYERQKKEWEARQRAWSADYTAACRVGSKKQLPPPYDDPPAEPVCRRLIVNEYTREKLHLLLSQNPGGLLSFRDELAGIFAQLDEVGHAGDKQFLMEMWNGHRYTRDTISRGTQHADSGISMLGGMTPQSLHRYLADANKKGGLDDGLLQRFQLSVLPDQQDWKDIDRLPNYNAMAATKATYERLLALDPARPLQFLFDPEAQQLFKAWLRELEAKVRDRTLHPAFTSHLSKYRSLMPSLALVFELADNTSQTTVSLEHAQQAAEWCSFLEAHARRIYSPAISAVRQAAVELGRHLMEGWKREEGKFTVRDVYRNQWRGLDKAEIVREALEILSDANWVRPLVSKPNGRPSEVYLISPRLKEVAPCPANG